MDEIEREEVEETSPEEATEEPVPESEPEEAPEEKPTEEDPKPEKPKETPEQKKARLTRELDRLNKKHPELAEEKPEPSQAKKGLNDLELGYLELKGITEQEDISLIQSVMDKTGQTFRQALSDEYVTSKLEANKKARVAADAVPSQTKRPGNSPVDDVDFWYAKYSQKWELPANMPKGMSEKVIARRYENENPNAAPF